MNYGDGKEFMLSSRFNDPANQSDGINPVSDSARRAAVEIAVRIGKAEFSDPLTNALQGLLRTWHAETELQVTEILESIISKHFAAAPADNDAESLRRTELPSPAQQALQIVTAWRAVVGGDDLLIHYIKQAIEENRADTTKGDR